MTLPPGSVLWLLAHDIRLAGRELRTGSRRKRLMLRGLLITILLVLHAAGYLGSEFLVILHQRKPGPLLLGVSLALAGAAMVFLSKAISESAESLFQRGDLDLLLSSPIPMRRVLTTRLLAIAVTAGFTTMLLVLPLVNGMMLDGEFAWAGLYPALIGMALLAAAFGAVFTFGLLAWLGPRWTKIAARALAAVFGGLTFVFIQAKLILGARLRGEIWTALEPDGTPWGVLWWPGRAALGETLPMIVVFVVAVLAVMLASAALGRAYAAGVMGTLALPRGARVAGVARRFEGGTLRALLRKEWLLMLRHPGLGAQVFYQAVFLVPGTVAMLNVGGPGRDSPAGVVFLTAMMTGRITKIIVAAPFESDQSEGLAATSPVPHRMVLRAKVLVTSLVVGVIAGLPVLAIGWFVAAAVPALWLASAAAAATRMGLAIARPRHLWRKGLQGRLRVSTDGVLGVAIDIGWGVAGALLFRFV